MCTMYVLVRVVYSVSFTFTGLYVCVSYLVRDDMAVLSSASQLQWTQRNASSSLSDVVRLRWQTERHRQATLVDTQRQACAHYVDDLTAAIAVKVDDSLTTARRVRQRYDSPMTITAVIASRLLDALVDYDLSLNDFKQRYRERLAGDMAGSLRLFTEYLSSVESSEWFGFARSLFNQSVESSGVQHLLFHGAAEQRFQSAVVDMPTNSHQSSGLNLSRLAADFASFVEIQEVEQIQLWSRQFWER